MKNKQPKIVEQEARTLEQVCDEESATKGFSMELLGNVYCSLALGKKVDCEHCGHYKDQNNLYPCINPLYQSLYHDDRDGKKDQ